MSSASLAFLTRLAPGDYAVDALGIGAGRERLASMRAQYGLDRPFIEQRTAPGWVELLRFDFGRSLALRPSGFRRHPGAGRKHCVACNDRPPDRHTGRTASGSCGGSRRAGAMPTMIRIGSLALLSMPPLLTSLFLVFLAARSRWLPIGGMGAGYVGRRQHCGFRSPFDCASSGVWRFRWRRCSSGCKRRRCAKSWASGTCWRRWRAGCLDRDWCGAMRSDSRSGQSLRSTASWSAPC